jgi:hypothetical protein
MRPKSTLWVAAIACGLTLAERAQCDDFHVDTKLFLPGEKQPSESTTLFHAGCVYDFISDPEEAIVFDADNDVFKLLDPQRKLQTEITTGQISANIIKLRTVFRPKADGSPVEKFYLDPRFAETQDPNTGELLLSSAYLDYKLKTMVPTNPQAARQYGKFADWSLQLNTVRKDKPMLPFPRLKVNDILKQRQELPLEVRLTIKPQKKGNKKPIEIRAEHSIQPRLSKEDLQRIADVGKQLHTFDKVAWEEYHRPDSQQATADKRR